jgi:osmotically-inducible protein OsmY
MGTTKDIRDAVEAELEFDPLVDDDSDVSVDTSGNTVTLRGHVRTWAERDARWRTSPAPSR